MVTTGDDTNWTASSEFGTYRLCEQRRFRRACASAQSRQNLRCSLIQAVSQAKPSDRKPDPWPLWMAGHAQLKCVMTECSKTQIRLTGLSYNSPQFSKYNSQIEQNTTLLKEKYALGFKTVISLWSLNDHLARFSEVLQGAWKWNPI